MSIADVNQLHTSAAGHHQAGRLAQAEVLYRQVLAHDPHHAGALHGLGVLAHEAGYLDDAIQMLRRALAQRPDFDECFTSLGNALREHGDLAAAMGAYRQAAALRPDYPSVHNNLAGALKDMGDVDAAIAEYRLALSLAPDFADARLNLGMALLLRGDWAEGWEAYESRREIRDLPYHKPRWDGADLQGRRILLHCRQGLGDVIQFVRFAPMVAARGGRVVLCCRPELARFLRGQCGIDQIVLHTDPLPNFDVHCPLLSLPGIFRTTLQSVVSPVAYLKPDPAPAAHWRARLGARTWERTIGLNWAGSPLPRRNRKRTIGVANLAPLAEVPGVRYVSLQKGASAEDLRTAPAGLRITDWSGDLIDFADTAALISNLDLVITCDTSVAHLAGALGVPVWVGLPFAPDWRWMLNRDDSPWYPTLRLFRQPRPGDWQSVTGRMAQELAVPH